MTALQIFEMFPTADRLYQVGATEFFLTEQEAEDFCKHFNRKDGYEVVEREEEVSQHQEVEKLVAELAAKKPATKVEKLVAELAAKKLVKPANAKATPGPKVLIEPVEGATLGPKINPDASVEE